VGFEEFFEVVLNAVVILVNVAQGDDDSNGYRFVAGEVVGQVLAGEDWFLLDLFGLFWTDDLQ